jgi:glucosamine--fructose-6-phosphate aminotransferase (isomerizing)
MRFSRKGIGGSNPLVSASPVIEEERMGMTEPGILMLKEISEIPNVIKELAQSFEGNSSYKTLLRDHPFSSVVILARGTSDNAAHFLKYLIETKVGLPCALASPSAATMYNAKFHYEKSLVIAISQSGQSTDLITFATAAKGGGGFLLSITNDPQSPLAKISDIHLPILAGPELAVPATKSYVGQLMISYLLVTSWVNESTDTEEIAKDCTNCLKDSTYIALADAIDIKRPIFVLGRGFSYPNAKEFALKLQETCLIPVQGMSTSDFLHGPIASIDSDSQVIFMSPNGLPTDSFGEAPDRVRVVTKHVYWVGSGELALEKEPHLGASTSKSEITASISDAILFQKVTHRLATKNGLNPDSPSGLTKITKTV